MAQLTPSTLEKYLINRIYQDAAAMKNMCSSEMILNNHDFERLESVSWQMSYLRSIIESFQDE